MALFTIITVCYNSEKTIEKTIQSILNQSCEDYEYLIIDGGSTDTTLEIIKKYEPEFNGKLKYVSEKDKGIYDAMNKGIDKATGEIIGIVNSDDYYELDTLENVKKLYETKKSNKCVIFGLLRCISGGKEKMIYSKNPAFIEEDMIAHPSCFIAKSIYDEYGKYSMDYKYSSDYEFMLRIHKDKDIEYIESLNVLSNFSIDGASSTANGYYETIELRHSYGLMSDKAYKKEMTKKKIKRLISRI